MPRVFIRVRQFTVFSVVASFVAITGSGGLLTDEVFGQPPSARGKGVAGPPAGPGGAGGRRPPTSPGPSGYPGSPPMHGGPGGFRPGMRPGMPGVPGGAPRQAKGTSAPDVNFPPDPEKLPIDYTPPAGQHELMAIDKPIASEKELDELKKDISKYKTALNRGEVDSTSTRLIERGVRYRLAQMTLKDNRKKLHTLREQLVVQDLPFAAKLKKKPDDIRAFRTVVLEEVVKQAAALFDNNFYVRLQAVVLLGELDLTENDTSTGLTLQAFAPAAKPLMAFLKDPAQPESIKPAAVRGLYRILRAGNPDTTLKHDIARVLADELAPNTTHFWYQMRLTEALSAADTVLDRNSRQPFVQNVLRSVVSDPARHWLVRTEAARSLGRVPGDPSLPVQENIALIAAMSLELTQAMQAEPNEVFWRNAFTKLYLAFQPLDADDKDAARKNPGGFLSNPSAAAAARDAYSQVLPVIRAVLRDEEVSDDSVKALEAWVAKNPPPGPKPVAQNAANEAGIGN